ncbi:magnesium transporter [Metaclostridioides mangenotii]|uniref:magnesium transporter n=1 Tax=Metaclostridioides mangenotii TaxID=1540 RepID=UPI0028E81CE2|nr:magnesium transporter [Clostridioides mangenotii]
MRLMGFINSSDYIGLKMELEKYNVVDIADFLETLKQDKMVLVFRLLPKDMSAEVFSYLTSNQQQYLIESITDSEIRYLLNGLFVDDAVDLLEEVPASMVKKILENINDEKRVLINQYLKYKPDSAGSIMTSEFVELGLKNTVKEAIDIIKKTGSNKETVYTCYVKNNERKLVGIVPLRTLMFESDEILVKDVMTTKIISITTNEDQEVVADMIRKYDLLSLPVVDSENRLVGIITVDDAMDVIEEENTEDFEKMAAISPSENEYLRTGVWELARNRIVWLLILMLSATITGSIISYFEDTLAAMIILTTFIPMLTDTGGNAGSQSATLVIRGLALGEIKTGDFLKVLWKEFRVSLICGLILSVVNFLRLVYISKVGIGIAFVVCITIALTVVIAKLVGGVLPIGAKKLGFDPALMASPLITTIVDSIVLVLYFYVASMVLGI